MTNIDQAGKSRDALISATIELLETVGHSRLRTADVAKQSGLSDGTLFHFFPTKHELVAAAVHRALDENLQRCAAEYSRLCQRATVKQRLELLWTLLSDHRLGWLYEMFAATQSDQKLDELIRPVVRQSWRSVDLLAATVVTQTGRVADEEEAAQVAHVAIWAMQGLVSRNLALGPSGLHGELIGYLEFLFDANYPDIVVSE
jgi:AcrR family transcriptional regulator